MKMIAVLLLCASEAASAIPIYKVIPEGVSTVQADGAELVGYHQVLTGRHWTWHGRARKYSYTPLYAVSAVPESSTYGMLLAGLGMVGWRVRAVNRSTVLGSKA